MDVFTDVQKKWEKASESGKQVTEASLKEIIYPHTITKSEPTVNETPKGRPTTKKKEATRLPSLHERIAMLYPPVKVAPKVREKEVHQHHYFLNHHYLKDMPDHFLPFILSTEDVAKDGNCGFHVVVEALGLKGSLEVGELDPISYVRDKMVTNLLKNQNMYKKMMTDEEFVELVNCIRPISKDEYLVLPGGKHIVPSDRWILMPKCGFVIAETFSCAVYYINRDMSYTFVPTLVKMRKGIKNRKVVMGFVEGNHFIGLRLKENCPLPPKTDNLWFLKHVKSDIPPSGTVKLRIE
ncbi:uncharacterized protein LOC113333237 [Papaver somniferum]|uniref:uncharacterized protein LOC113333237 n=1 Tax=Papaver somniferum TaxID=3469 RepID=UPI000E6FF1ED|nr:uncharacterized protein LOC113333237 [Papaver somniferum]